MPLRVGLAEEDERNLKKYIYEITLETVNQVRSDAGLDRDLVNKTGIIEFLECSPQFLDELMVQGLPYTLIGSKKYYFSKQEVRKWIIEYNKK